MRPPREDREVAALDWAVGCDIGGTAIKLARLRGSRVEAALEVPTPAAARPGPLVETIAQSIASVLGEGRARVPVGIAVPGFLDAERRRVVRLSNLPALDGVALAREVERRVPRARVTLDADTNAGAVGEALAGAGRGFERVLYVTMGTGLGAALVVGGRPVRVSRHTVGQVAHVPLDPEGPRCYCGERGCAETILSASGILWRARRLQVREPQDAEELWRIALERSRRAAAPARRVWREAGEALGRLLCLLAGLFSPDVAVLGGGLAGAAALLLPEARRRLERHLTPRLEPSIALRPASLGRQAGAIGAALLARSGG